MHKVIEALSRAGCDVAYGLKMHSGQEEYYLKELRQFAYDTTIRKLGEAVHSGNTGLCYLYSKALLPLYAGLGFTQALYISDSLAESSRSGMTAQLRPLFSRLSELHDLYAEIIKVS